MLLKIIGIFFLLVSFSWSVAINRKGYVVMEMFDKVTTGGIMQQLYGYYTTDNSKNHQQSSINIAPAMFVFAGPDEFVEKYKGININYSFFNKDASARYGVIFNFGKGNFSSSYDVSEYQYNNFNGGFFLEKIKSVTERSYLFFLATNKYSKNLSRLDINYIQTMYYGKYINIKDRNISHNILFQRAFGIEVLSFFGADETTTRIDASKILPNFGDIGFFYSPTFVFFLDKNAYFKLGAELELYLNGTKHFTDNRPSVAQTIPELMERMQDYSQALLGLFFVFHTGDLDFYVTKYKQGEFDNTSIFVDYKFYSF